MTEIDFNLLFNIVAPYTLLSYERLHGLYKAIVDAIENNVPGDLIECGTAKGGSAALMGLTLKLLNSDRTLWVCDTFEGIPSATKDDPAEAMQYTGDFKGEIAEVEALFNELGIAENCKLVKGLFQDTLPTLPIKAIAVAHFDGDWYESTKCCLEALYDKVSPHGFIQIDDYGHWAGCRKAVDEFFRKRSIVAALHHLDYTGVQFMKEGN